MVLLYTIRYIYVIALTCPSFLISCRFCLMVILIERVQSSNGFRFDCTSLDVFFLCCNLLKDDISIGDLVFSMISDNNIRV